MPLFSRSLVMLAGLLPIAAGAAGPDWSYCKPPPVLAEDEYLQPDADGATHISADTLDSSSSNSLVFDGAVELRGQGRLLKADRVRVFDKPRRFEASGHIEVRATDLLLRSDSAALSEIDNSGEFENVEYSLTQRHAFGRATRVATKGEVLTLEKANYSSCEVNDPDWVIQAGRIKLDRGAGLGTAKNATLRFLGVPLIYLPYITFPIDDQRRTGMLYPVIGSSNVAGFQLSTPFYWNMAPNYDMTLSPRFMEKRGVMLNDEIRYLGHHSKSKVNLEYLQNDRVLNRKRYNYSIDHEHRITRHWELQLEGTFVSDPDYLTDFSNGLNSSSRTHLERFADLLYHSRHWKGVIRNQVYQTIDTTIPLADRPYRRLPQISAEGSQAFLGEHLNLSLATDITRFTHDDAVEGRRFDVAPSLEYRWVTPGAFVKPSMTWRYTYYDLDDFEETQGRVITRELPVASIDSGLIFERELQHDSTLTLEPRLFYLYAPFRDQSEIPIFDSNEPAFIFSSLFRENRFSGLDRIGDANQLTTALTSRIFDNHTGRELFRASLGQIHYFADRRVTLPDSDLDTSTRSNYLAEISSNPSSKWVISGHLVTDSDLAKAEVATMNLGYRRASNKVANIEHRFRRADDVNQTALSWAWPLSRNWKFLGRWLFSHTRDLDLEVISGLEYESCCWKARIVSRRYILDEQEEYNNNIYVQLILKGLASFGTGSTLVEQSISGYQVNDE
jgi:LPS-assembly protein